MNLLFIAVLGLLFSSESLVQKNSCERDKDVILNLVSRFENYQKERNVRGVFSLFTPPITVEEKGLHSHFLEATQAFQGSIATL